MFVTLDKCMIVDETWNRQLVNWNNIIMYSLHI